MTSQQPNKTDPEGSQARDCDPPGATGEDPALAGSTPELRIAALEAELAQGRDQLLRTLAELENMRKRAVREREDAAKYAASAFAKDLLSVADNLRRALEAAPADVKGSAIVQGVEATEREMLKAFEKNGIRRIDPSGVLFDPNFHEVMFESPVPGKPDGTVFQVLEAGYVLNDRLLRPARVGVVRNAPGTHTVDQQA
ncbi:MAG TPA: nucleotide exchange factor GrpE [Alphaproteobacteria bacterium]|nr:nucleotide exchange factor GrpE [Alphaproteobacteria bacterium]